MDNRTENHLDQNDDPIVYRGKKIRFHVNDKNKPYLLIVFVLVFAAVATNVFLSSRAASSTNTKTWSTAADWDSGTLSNTIINGNSITLSPVVTAAAATSTTPTSTGTSTTSTVIANNSSSSVTDASSNKWTVTKGIVYENGSKAGYTANVNEVAYVGTTIWQENTSSLWWYWTGSAWAGQTSTSPVKTTATTTTTPTSTGTSTTSTVIANNSSSSVTDASSNKWTVTKGIVYENGSKAGYTANVNEVAYVGTTIWQENTSSLWWYWTGSAWAGQTSTSPVKTTATTTTTPTSTGSTTTTYPASGTILLDFDATATATWNSLTGTTSTPTGTSVAYQARTSTNNSTWSAWTSTISSAAATRYIEIEATLSTTNSSATPSLSKLALSYTIQATATPAPTVTLSASPTSVTSSQSSTLTWSSTNATSCTASGSWSGTKATSGTTSTGAITSTSTYTLACTGTGGTATQSTTVTATAASTGTTGTSSSFVPYSSTGSGPTKVEGFAVTGSDFVADPTGELTEMLKLFPSVDSLRIAIGTSASNVVPSVNEQSLITAVNDAVQMIPSVQIILDDHESEGAQQTGDTAADLALYTQWGNDFKNNTHVSFNTNNEPGGDSITINSAEAQEYNAIRATGAENRIWLEDGGVFPTDTQNSINSNKMVNIGMDTHFYPNTATSTASNDYNNDGAIGITDSQGVPLQQAAFEFGPSITGPPSGDLSNSTAYVGQVVSLITSGKLVMGDAWVWSNGGSGDGLEDLIVDQNNNIQQFGTLLQQDGFGQ